MTCEILLVTDSKQGGIDPLTVELIAFSRKHPQFRAASVTLVIPGWRLEKEAERMAAEWGVHVALMPTSNDLPMSPPMMAQALQDLIVEMKPALVCFLHTMRGAYLAASLSVRNEAACVTAVQGLKMEEDKLLYERGLFNGLLISQVEALSSQTFVTILQGAFGLEKENGSPSTQGRVTIIDGVYGERGVEILELKPAGEKDAALEEAEVIVAGGRGVGDPENLSLIRELAAIFPKGAVAGSKPICDLKWLPYSRQVGVTGKSVSPKLYLACGISGALQHITGMKNSRWVAAINKDPKALIFSHADYGVVEDLSTFIPILIETFKKHYQPGGPG